MRTRPRLLADTTPLRESRRYRSFFPNEGLAFLGSQITVVAVPLQVYLLLAIAGAPAPVPPEADAA